MITCSPFIKNYFNALEKETRRAYEVAESARARGFDAEQRAEIFLAQDVAARVEGLVGPAGVAPRIRELTQQFSREEACIKIAQEILEKKFWGDAAARASAVAGVAGDEELQEKLIEQAVRTAFALFTEGVVSAPIEGISRIRIRRNSDGSRYLAMYFAGPIRGAGGTGQAFSIVLGDYCRRAFGIAEYRPLGDEVDRYVEESNLYALRTRVGQYAITEEEVRHVVTNCPVCVDGEPTEDYEVSVHKNIASVETNRVRGGVCLVLSEGVCLKAAKILRITRKLGLDWSWLEKLIKVAKKEATQVTIRPVEKFMDEIVGGRPIFCYPMRAGGFRLRYGRTRFTGIQSKAIHPATMEILDAFPAFGTQLKTERPSKGCISTPCNEVEGPIVLFEDGEVRQLNSVEEAREARAGGRVKEILSLGDLLVSFGDFANSNHPLVPSAWCEEWMKEELAAKGCVKTVEEIRALSFDDAVELSKKFGVALAPRYTFFWHDLTAGELKELVDWICGDGGKLEFDWFSFKQLALPNEASKRLLEVLCVPHRVNAEDEVVIEKDFALALLHSLGLLADGSKKMSRKKFDDAYKEEKDAMQLLNEAAAFKVRKKAGIYIGTSMGRPEKSRRREMQPPIQALYPIGNAGGRLRDVARAVQDLKARGERVIEAEVCLRACPACGARTFKNKCDCGAQTIAVRECLSCRKVARSDAAGAGDGGKSKGGNGGECACGGKTTGFKATSIDLVKEFDDACARVNYKPSDLKAVIGLISSDKTPEPLEKGILRRKHDVLVFRDGTIRFDATEIPLTHFTPAEIGATPEEIKALGYERDIHGKPITDGWQTIELMPQDIIVSKNAGDYLMHVSAFIDDLLVYLYGLQAYYNARAPRDLIGKLCIAIAPHTSAGIVARIIGFTDVRGILAHPYMHCAARRNADGDELAIMLLLDGLLNFSRHYLPATRGGQMDAPLVLTTAIDPREVDNEVHVMECCWSYPLEFFEATERYASPSELKLDTVATRLETNGQYEGIGFTHGARIEGPVETRYVELKNMRQKVEDELALMTKIRAVDADNAAERLILSHFFPDLYGNLRKFSRQKLRCVDCNAKYRRAPLAGKCLKCGGKLVLTVSKGSIEKYLAISKELVEEFGLPHYLKQRLMLLEREIESIFESDASKQFSLSNYL